MSDTQALLARIAAIRHQLGQAQGMLLDAHCEVADLADAEATGNAAEPLARRLAAGERATAMLDRSLRMIHNASTCTADEKPMTVRARAGLKRCQKLVHELRALGDSIEPLHEHLALSVADAHRRCTELAAAAVRYGQSLPADACEQTRLCEGLDGLLDALADRIGGLKAAVCHLGRLNEQWASLSHLLTGLKAGSNLALDSFTALAEAVVRDARQGEPLDIIALDPISPASPSSIAVEWQTRSIAGHALTAAQVVARVAPHYAPCSHDVTDSVVAALLHDVGMLDVPFVILAQPGRLTGEQWRVVEAHAAGGAELISRHIPGAALLAVAVALHHERLDGTGYPQGRRDPIDLARLLAVCDVYAALLQPRPHREALDPRAALTEVVLQAERGALDPAAVAALQQLSFYPEGTVVQLNDGQIGVVVATHEPASQPHAAARPVVALLADETGQHPARGLEVCDLARDSRRCVVKTLGRHERRLRLGSRFPQYA